MARNLFVLLCCLCRHLIHFPFSEIQFSLSSIHSLLAYLWFGFCCCCHTPLCLVFFAFIKRIFLLFMKMFASDKSVWKMIYDKWNNCVVEGGEGFSEDISIVLTFLTLHCSLFGRLLLFWMEDEEVAVGIIWRRGFLRGDQSLKREDYVHESFSRRIMHQCWCLRRF